ncbi:predicted protein [Plenodomus lingam JN3]|uniref:Predicted protein n=2 Tax=Leptosphaeria maculans TaxID=5022 RepID=E4ZWH1_LEPMJ|nr:predicted protein [Plenodomus lingam JN3]CBX95947.1 predicted protein [Plenodomus lingam JN3]
MAVPSTCDGFNGLSCEKGRAWPVWLLRLSRTSPLKRSDYLGYLCEVPTLRSPPVASALTRPPNDKQQHMDHTPPAGHPRLFFFAAT